MKKINKIKKEIERNRMRKSHNVAESPVLKLPGHVAQSQLAQVSTAEGSAHPSPTHNTHQLIPADVSQYEQLKNQLNNYRIRSHEYQESCKYPKLIDDSVQ